MSRVFHAVKIQLKFRPDMLGLVFLLPGFYGV